MKYRGSKVLNYAIRQSLFPIGIEFCSAVAFENEIHKLFWYPMNHGKLYSNKKGIIFFPFLSSPLAAVLPSVVVLFLFVCLFKVWRILYIYIYIYIYIYNIYLLNHLSQYTPTPPSFNPFLGSDRFEFGNDFYGRLLSAGLVSLFTTSRKL